MLVLLLLGCACIHDVGEKTTPPRGLTEPKIFVISADGLDLNAIHEYVYLQPGSQLREFFDSPDVITIEAPTLVPSDSDSVQQEYFEALADVSSQLTRLTVDDFLSSPEQALHHRAILVNWTKEVRPADVDRVLRVAKEVLPPTVRIVITSSFPRPPKPEHLAGLPEARIAASPGVILEDGARALAQLNLESVTRGHILRVRQHVVELYESHSGVFLPIIDSNSYVGSYAALVSGQLGPNDLAFLPTCESKPCQIEQAWIASDGVTSVPERLRSRLPAPNLVAAWIYGAITGERFPVDADADFVELYPLASQCDSIDACIKVIRLASASEAASALSTVFAKVGGLSRVKQRAAFKLADRVRGGQGCATKPEAPQVCVFPPIVHQIPRLAESLALAFGAGRPGRTMAFERPDGQVTIVQHIPELQRWIGKALFESTVSNSADVEQQLAAHTSLASAVHAQFAGLPNQALLFYDGTKHVSPVLRELRNVLAHWAAAAAGVKHETWSQFEMPTSEDVYRMHSRFSLGFTGVVYDKGDYGFDANELMKLYEPFSICSSNQDEASLLQMIDKIANAGFPDLAARLVTTFWHQLGQKKDEAESRLANWLALPESGWISATILTHHLSSNRGFFDVILSGGTSTVVPPELTQIFADGMAVKLRDIQESATGAERNRLLRAQLQSVMILKAAASSSVVVDSYRSLLGFREHEYRDTLQFAIQYAKVDPMEILHNFHGFVRKVAVARTYLSSALPSLDFDLHSSDEQTLVVGTYHVFEALVRFYYGEPGWDAHLDSARMAFSTLPATIPLTDFGWWFPFVDSAVLWAQGALDLSRGDTEVANTKFASCAQRLTGQLSVLGMNLDQDAVRPALTFFASIAGDWIAGDGSDNVMAKLEAVDKDLRADPRSSVERRVLSAIVASFRYVNDEALSAAERRKLLDYILSVSNIEGSVADAQHPWAQAVASAALLVTSRIDEIREQIVEDDEEGTSVVLDVMLDEAGSFLRVAKNELAGSYPLESRDEVLQNSEEILDVLAVLLIELSEAHDANADLGEVLRRQFDRTDILGKTMISMVVLVFELEIPGLSESAVSYGRASGLSTWSAVASMLHAGNLIRDGQAPRAEAMLTALARECAPLEWELQLGIAAARVEQGDYAGALAASRRHLLSAIASDRGLLNPSTGWIGHYFGGNMQMKFITPLETVFWSVGDFSWFMGASMEFMHNSKGEVAPRPASPSDFSLSPGRELLSKTVERAALLHAWLALLCSEVDDLDLAIGVLLDVHGGFYGVGNPVIGTIGSTNWYAGALEEHKMYYWLGMLAHARGYDEGVGLFYGFGELQKSHVEGYIADGLVDQLLELTAPEVNEEALSEWLERIEAQQPAAAKEIAGRAFGREDRSWALLDEPCGSLLFRGAPSPGQGDGECESASLFVKWLLTRAAGMEDFERLLALVEMLESTPDVGTRGMLLAGHHLSVHDRLLEMIDQGWDGTVDSFRDRALALVERSPMIGCDYLMHKLDVPPEEIAITAEAIFERECAQ